MVETTISLLGFVLTLVFGILVLMFPKMLNRLVGIYLIVIGAVGIISYLL
jgi:uncharacterized membrane protein